MYRQNKTKTTSLNVNKSYEGERLEEKINRIVNNKEPIKDGAPIIYTERTEGVKPEYDIRTDRWEVALDAMDNVSKSHIAKREHRINEKKKQDEAKVIKIDKDGKPEPLQGTGGDPTKQ